jgi:hypothetical protein
MRIELWRLSDDHPFNTHDIGVPVAEDDLPELARDILMSYYEGDGVGLPVTLGPQTLIWPIRLLPNQVAVRDWLE